MALDCHFHLQCLRVIEDACWTSAPILAYFLLPLGYAAPSSETRRFEPILASCHCSL